MASVIKLKRSTTGGSAPSGGALQAGELAINLADRKLFSSTNGSDIITISGDRYNIDTTAVTHTGGGATIRLTKDGAAYDDIDILGSSSVTVTRESNGAISLATTAGSTFAGDSGSASPSSGTVTIAGGSGITTSATGSTVTVAGDDASTSAKGVASFNSNDFSTSSGAVSIKALGVSNAQLAGSIADSKLATISTADKVALTALAIEGGTAEVPAIADEIIFKDDGDDGIHKATIGKLVSTITGDITVADTGVSTIAAGAVDNAMLAGSIANNKLANDSVSFGGVSLDLGQSDATPAFDLTDATNYPTSSLTGTITNAQLAGSIADSKLNTITTADKVSAAAIQVDGATDGTGITLATTDKLIVDDAGTTKYINASQLNTYLSGQGFTTDDPTALAIALG